MKKGKIFILSGPTRSGKDVIVKNLIKKKNLNLRCAVTMTTRPQRYYEKHGRDHFFISEKKFKQSIKEKKILEWAPVRNYLFGTPKDQVLGEVKKGKNIILKIDVRGAMQIKKKMPDVILIFIKPGTMGEIKKRMIRSKFKPEQIRIRLKEAKNELALSKKYDYIILNPEGKLKETIKKVTKLIRELLLDPAGSSK